MTLSERPHRKYLCAHCIAHAWAHATVWRLWWPSAVEVISARPEAKA